MDFNNVICDRLRQENIELIRDNAELTNRIRFVQDVNRAILEELFKVCRENEELVQQLKDLREELDGLKTVKTCNDVCHDDSNRACKQTEDDTVVVLETILKDYFTHLY